MKKYRILPLHLRRALKKPLGKLFDSKDAVKALKNKKIIISVGDITTEFLLKNKIIPKLCFFDFRSKRKKIRKKLESKLRKINALEINVKNSPGTLSDKIMEKTKSALKIKENVKIIVDGEEDLAVIPSCIFAPLKSTIAYGQPNKGIVLIEVTKRMKKRAKNIYNKFSI